MKKPKADGAGKKRTTGHIVGGRVATKNPTFDKKLQREFSLLADDADDAKVKAKQILAIEGYDEKLLHHATWTVSRLIHPRKR